MLEKRVLIGKSNDLDKEGFFVSKTPDGRDIVVFRINDSLYGTQRFCPHQRFPLDQGQVIGKIIKCGLHGYMFDLETGEGVNCPGYEIVVYSVEQSNDELYLVLKEERT
jgi:nitrite reductase/ring-hydroxylating ferredoxin subunit